MDNDTQLTIDNYSTLQGLVIGTAHELCKATGRTLGETYGEATRQVAELANVSSEDLVHYLAENRAKAKSLKKKRGNILVKSEAVDSQSEVRKEIEDLLRTTLVNVPPDGGHKFTFASAELALTARAMLSCITHDLWNGVRREKKVVYYRAELKGRVLIVWRLA